jgi:hypothetical protein
LIIYNNIRLATIYTGCQMIWLGTNMLVILPRKVSNGYIYWDNWKLLAYQIKTWFSFTFLLFDQCLSMLPPFGPTYRSTYPMILNPFNEGH